MRQHGRWCRWLAALLLAVLLLGAGTVSADSVQKNYFILSAVGNGVVIIAPERVYYEENQTVKDALLATDHTFTEGSSGFITAIDDVIASFRRSDQDGSYDLSALASTVTHFCFTDRSETAQPSEARQSLMTAMADYLEEPADVQQASADAYKKALDTYLSIEETAFSTCQTALENAIKAYEADLNGTTYAVTFSGLAGKTIEAVNAYGKSYIDEDRDGMLSLPAGSYRFTVEDGKYRVSGEFSVENTAVTISAALPTGDWLNKSEAAFSGSKDENFEDNQFSATWQNDTCTVAVPDTFSGVIYSYLTHTLGDGNTPQVQMLYTDTNGKAQVFKEAAFGSKKSGPDKVLTTGTAGNTVTLRLSKANENGYTQSMDYTLQFDRTPSLKALTVKDQAGVLQAADQAFSPDELTYTYRVINTVTAITVTPQPMAAGYTVTVNGQALVNGSADVTLNATGNTEVEIKVVGGSYETVYTLTVEPAEAVQVSIVTDDGAKVQVFNQYGEEQGYTTTKETTYVRYTYQLVKDAKYTYLVTKDTYYHATNEFTADKGKNINVKNLSTEDHLTDLALGSYRDGKGNIPLEQTFAPESHSYTAVYSDQSAAVVIFAEAEAGSQLTAQYRKISAAASTNHVLTTETLSEGKAQLKSFLMSKSGYGNTVVLRVTQAPAQTGGITYYQEYEITVRRRLSLENLQIACGGESVLLTQTGTGTTGYHEAVTDYTVMVPAAATSLDLTATTHTTTSYRYGDTGHGYAVTVGETAATSGSAVLVPLSGKAEAETVTVTVTNEHDPDNQTEITIRVQKAAPLTATVALKPENALLAVYETQSGKRIWPEDGAYALSVGFTYEYLLSAKGYVGKSGKMVVAEGLDGSITLTLDGQAYNATAKDGKQTVSLSLSLNEAQKNSQLNPNLKTQWPSFRGNADNNGVVNFQTPITAESGTLYWAEKLGEVVSSPILVDGDLVVYSGSSICRVDKTTGKIVKEGTMVSESNYSIMPPTYAEGMIFVGLKEGTIQAFDAQTLESLWVYHDPLKGQPNSTITVYDGYLYTGFWNNETKDANFVCLSITDEDPNDTDEIKTAAWRWTQKGGFYWAGAYVCKDYLLVGTDDGANSTSNSASLLLLEPKTGRLLDRWDGLCGDIRCAISRDSETGAFYFTSKGGYFYGVSVKEQSGSWVLDGKWQVQLQNGTDSVPMSTSTPVVSNGRAYVGVSGSGQFSDGSGHNITVIDLSNKKIAYRVGTRGYCQTSGLLTTAYDGSNYVYFMENSTLGTMRLIKDAPGQTDPVLTTVEDGVALAYSLFTPSGAQAQYCICSPIADENGVLYFKNDSGYLMAYGATVTELEITNAPARTEYAAGETFDGTGMQVTATFSNGKTMDVTRYVTWNTEPLKQDDMIVTVTYPYGMYQNRPGAGGEMLTGQNTDTPTVTQAITVTQPAEATSITGVTAGNGTVTVQFDGAIQAQWKIFVAYYDGNGKMVSVKQATFTSGATSATADLVIGAAQVKAFVLGENHQPVMKNGTGTIES